MSEVSEEIVHPKLDMKQKLNKIVREERKHYNELASREKHKYTKKNNEENTKEKETPTRNTPTRNVKYNNKQKKIAKKNNEEDNEEWDIIPCDNIVSKERKKT